MAKTITFKLKAYRISYFIIAVLSALFTCFLVGRGIVVGINNGIEFNQTLNLITLVILLMFEIGIISFIFRSLKGGQTLLIKHLVFKRDGTPYWSGIVIVAVGALITLLFGVLLAVKVLVPQMVLDSRLLVVDVFLTCSLHLIFVLIYAIVFSHESGTFQII